ncbi:unnamed protein product [Cuscuta campestris]|uniref:Retrotransposon Copia-like N-terminal domain-containing protein n=1 Tax=Cuscuta campestris TaxID=132261 RepID=A0A484MJS7_9ASTE|nr:unnamed protein product [Cuscuta campestris]
MGIETLNGANFSSWKDSLMLTLGMLDFDYALREPAPPSLTDKSTAEDKIVHERWERCNRMALMLIKNSISIIIRGAIPDSSNAKIYLASVEEQFKATSKAHASTLILKMVTTKYDGNSGIREHIMMMNDMAPFKVNYNTQKVKWSMNELIAMCVQEEERLKLDKPDVAYLMTANPKKRKGNVDKKDVSKLYCDNSAAVSFSNSNSSTGAALYLDTKYLFVRERVEENKLCIEHISTKNMLADPMTKGLPPKIFEEHVSKMGLSKDLI